MIKFTIYSNSSNPFDELHASSSQYSQITHSLDQATPTSRFWWNNNNNNVNWGGT